MGETKKLVSNSFIVIVGSLIASVFSYLFNMLMGRFLGLNQYGELTALMSLLVIVSVGGGAVLTIVMRYSGELYARGLYRSLRRLIATFNKFVIAMASVIFLLGVFFSSPIANFLKIGHPMYVIVMFAGLFFGFLIVVNRGALQGSQRFVPLSISSIIESFLKLMLGLFFVFVGLKLLGAIFAIILGTAITYLYTVLPISKLTHIPDNHPENEDFRFDKKEMIKFSLPTTIAAVVLAVSINLDILLVKHYFPSDIAGQYAAISTISKIGLYLLSPIISVMFPMISEKITKGEKHFKILIGATLLTAAGSALMIGAYLVAPGLIVKILYGDKYLAAAFLLAPLGIYVMFYSLINLFANYFIAIKDFVFVSLYVVVIVIQIVMINLAHNSLLDVAKILISTTGLLFATLSVYYLITKRNQIGQYFQGVYGQES